MLKTREPAGVKLNQVNPTKAIDLSSEKVIQDARRRRKLNGRRDEVDQELDRITRRISWLSRKASRLPVASNGRRKAIREAATLQALAQNLTQALAGTPVGKLKLTGLPHPDRAVRLLADLGATTSE